MALPFVPAPPAAAARTAPTLQVSELGRTAVPTGADRTALINSMAAGVERLRSSARSLLGSPLGDLVMAQQPIPQQQPQPLPLPPCAGSAPPAGGASSAAPQRDLSQLFAAGVPAAGPPFRPGYDANWGGQGWSIAARRHGPDAVSGFMSAMSANTVQAATVVRSPSQPRASPGLGQSAAAVSATLSAAAESSPPLPPPLPPVDDGAELAVAAKPAAATRRVLTAPSEKQTPRHGGGGRGAGAKEGCRNASCSWGRSKLPFPVGLGKCFCVIVANKPTVEKLQKAELKIAGASPLQLILCSHACLTPLFPAEWFAGKGGSSSWSKTEKEVKIMEMMAQIEPAKAAAAPSMQVYWVPTADSRWAHLQHVVCAAAATGAGVAAKDDHTQRRMRVGGGGRLEPTDHATKCARAVRHVASPPLDSHLCTQEA